MTQIIAFVFDFDDTLAPDTTSSYLKNKGVDIDAFWGLQVNSLLKKGWDPVPAYLYQLFTLQKTSNLSPITQPDLQIWGKKLKLYNGVETLFERLSAHAHQLNPEISLEFYLISSGIGEIIRYTPIAHHFTNIWACEFHFNEENCLTFPKRIVSFTDKTRCLFQISKGVLGKESHAHPFDVNRKMERTELRIPLNQMIFIGDGYTDIPCFSLIKKAGGTAIAVCDSDDREKWSRAWNFFKEQRVTHCAKADYCERSALSRSLLNVLESTIKRVEPSIV